MTNLAPVPSEDAVCANCSAPLVADQRYCLSCGQPCSPVRLAFLDVLESERRPQLAAGAVSTMPVAYNPYMEPPPAGPAWLRRYAPVFAVVSVLLLAMIVGLLIGHWVTQSKAPSGPQVVKVEGFPAVASSGTSTAPNTATAPATPSTPSKSDSTSGKSEEEKELAEAKAEEKAEEKAPAKAPEAKKVSAPAITKLEKSTGKAKERELEKIGSAPIEVK